MIGIVARSARAPPSRLCAPAAPCRCRRRDLPRAARTDALVSCRPASECGDRSFAACARRRSGSPPGLPARSRSGAVRRGPMTGGGPARVMAPRRRISRSIGRVNGRPPRRGTPASADDSDPIRVTSPARIAARVSVAHGAVARRSGRPAGTLSPPVGARRDAPGGLPMRDDRRLRHVPRRPYRQRGHARYRGRPKVRPGHICIATGRNPLRRFAGTPRYRHRCSPFVRLLTEPTAA